ncbi:intracellular protein transport protein USO1-like isoform X2 [Gigantopelta aegis]|uniref:intracellular protein transport protein USO1-like isoform X2 n=1 Tax=Gigantopelta aegis TaxID=1735272 RepID=UPI001B88DDE0|nr:intracellular protein transport protein USO1-like isoform X2 [Gigantopelta aegis]
MKEKQEQTKGFASTMEKLQAENRQLQQALEETKCRLNTKTKACMMAEEKMKHLCCQLDDLKKQMEKLQAENRQLQEALEETKCRLNAETKARMMAEEKNRHLCFELDDLKKQMQAKKHVEQTVESLQADNSALQQSLEETKSRLAAETRAHKTSQQKITELCIQTEQLKKEKIKFNEYTQEIRTQSKTTLIQVASATSHNTPCKEYHTRPCKEYRASPCEEYRDHPCVEYHSENTVTASQEKIHMLQAEVCKLQEALGTRNNLVELKYQKKNLELEQKYCEEQQCIKKELALKNQENCRLQEEMRELKEQLSHRSTGLHQASGSHQKPNKSGVSQMNFEVTVESSLHSITKDKEADRRPASSHMMLNSTHVSGTGHNNSLTQNSRLPKTRTERINELIANSQERAKQLLNSDAYNKTFNNNTYATQKFINNLRHGCFIKNGISQNSDYSLCHCGPVYLTMRKTKSEHLCRITQ